MERLSLLFLILTCFVIYVCMDLDYGGKTGLEFNTAVQSNRRADFRYAADLGHRTTTLLMPECQNLLNNMTVGSWVTKLDSGLYDESERIKLLNAEDNITAELTDFWNKRGIQSSLWRKDLKCGYKVPQTKPRGSKWPAVGSWCDGKSERPCCSNAENGVCYMPNDGKCDCVNCVDMRKQIYAEVSDWRVADDRCRWRNYSGDEACDVITASPYDDFYFIGDSLVRNMFGALLMLLSEDPVRGAWSRALPKDLEGLCSGPQRFFWRECRLPPQTIKGLHEGGRICKLHDKPPANFTRISVTNGASMFLDTVAKKLGKKGSLVLLGVALHIRCDPSVVINNFLRPALTMIQNYYGRHPDKCPTSNINISSDSNANCETWPKIMFVSPPTMGLLKPPVYFKAQGRERCLRFGETMKRFCDAKRIPFIDITLLSANILSFDGTHHGYAVNAMKVQILLNYIATTSTK